MAKIPFSKLGVKNNAETVQLHWNDQIIDVLQYLPMESKAELIGKVINYSGNDIGFYNPLQLKVFLTLETIYAYTNISFTEKQKENALKLYDMVISSKLFDKIVELIPESEWHELKEGVETTISNIYEYKNSMMGILEAISTDYNNLNLDANEIQAKLNDPDNLALLKDVVTKLG